MKDKSLPAPVRFLVFLLIFGIICVIFTQGELYQSAPTHAPEAETKTRIETVVLDAGHGGEDGGAVSDCGLVEKDLNLKVTRKLAELLRANGINVIMTRDRDELLYDKTVDYKGRKKVLDLKARKEIAEKTENCVFVSIHMNTHPIKTCKGLQVWYSQNDPRSQELATSIQTTVTHLIQPQNKRLPKASIGTIYLLDKLTMPSVLIECGFLSNEDDARLLGNENYQHQLAISLFLSIIQTDFSN